MEEVGRIYLDTNVFIAAFETGGDRAEKADRLLSTAGVANPQRFVTSELTLGELLVLPYRKDDAALIGLYQTLLSSSRWLDVRPVTRDVLSGAARLRAANPARKLPDAVHVATAVLCGCAHVLSADRGIGPGPGETLSITVIRPDEPTLNTLIESLSE